MPHHTKIATCSYCGTRQALSLTARAGHELACSSCGAPLHEMKWLRAPDGKSDKKKSPRRTAPHGRPVPPTAAGQREWRGDEDWGAERRRPKKSKKKKSFWSKAFEEAFDVIEDIFD